MHYYLFNFLLMGVIWGGVNSPTLNLNCKDEVSFKIVLVTKYSYSAGNVCLYPECSYTEKKKSNIFLFLLLW